MTNVRCTLSHSFLLLLTGIFLTTVYSCREQPSHQSPYSPQDALSTFQLPEGYAIQLVASEPLISDPVEVAFDEDGKMYVVQMDDYPSEDMDDYGQGKAPKSKIMLLEDKDGDGFYESGTVFAEGLQYANGVMPWKGGVLVTSAPDILFLKDTDGDGKADEKKVVLTGFAVSNPQLRMSSLRYGLDNWIYAAYSRAGGGRWREAFMGKGSPLHFPDKSGQRLAELLPGKNIRFMPDEYKAEVSGGMSQFGLSFDGQENQFTVWNNVHINDKYAANNSYLSINATMADISDHGNAAPVYSIAKDMLNLHESEMGHFTSACGICEYTGGLFKDKYARASFVCEPVSNLVHADILSPDGVTFKAERAEKEKEFLASVDSWFRPVNSTVGPDGALYVVDFYRKLVEHPDWLAMADSTGFYTHAGKIKESDFLEGNDLGRVYRIVPKGFKAGENKMPALSKAAVKDLVGYLNHPNKWWRTNAQRLLVDRKDQNAVPLIIDLLSTPISPEGKIHALWTLEGLNALSDTLLEKSLQDADPIVKKQAVLLGEKRMDKKNIFEGVLNAASDPDAAVQFQAALTVSNVANSNASGFQALHKIISAHINDKWFQDAVLLSASGNAVQWYEAFKDFAADNDSGNVGKKEFLSKITSIVGAKYKRDELSSLVKMIAGVKDTGVIVSSLQGAVTGMKRNNDKMKLSAEGQSSLVGLMADHPNNVRTAAIAMASRLQLVSSADLANIIGSSKTVAAQESQPVENRVLAVKVLGLDPAGIPFPLLERLLQSDQPADIQLAVANVLLSNPKDASTNILLNKWNTFNPKVHEVVETGFLSRTNRVRSLVKAIESDQIKPAWISRNTQNRLLRYSDTTISAAAKNIFKDVSQGNREQLILDYNVSTTRSGDPAKGKAVFKTVCSTCHALEGVGVNFGPDLHSISHQTRINLLTMILDPNHDIAAGYEGYTIETSDGGAFAGIIENETDNNIRLKGPGGVTQTILKSNVKSMSPMPVSLMPEGLEASINKEDMADLLEYIKTLR